MSMFTLQTLGLILAFGLIGALIGWLFRSFFCKPGKGSANVNLYGGAKGGTTVKTGGADAAINTSVDTSYNKTGSSASVSTGDVSADTGGVNKTATAAAAGISAVAAAAVASSAKDNAADAADSVAEGISGTIDSAQDAVSGAVDSAQDAALEAVDAAGDAVSGTLESVTGTVTESVDGIKDAANAVSGAVDAASGAVSGIPDQASGVVSDAVDSATGAVSGAIDSASNTATEIASDAASSVSGAVDAVSGAVDSASDAISDTVDSASDGISGAAGMAGAAAVAAAAYSVSSSADESEAPNTNSGDAQTATAQGIVGQADSPKQLREDAETMLKEDFTDSTSAYGANHIIIGAGPAGIVAAETIRKLDSSANVTVIGDEPEAPYSRMAIPYFLEENIQAEGTHLRKTENHFDNAGIEILSGRVKSVDTENKSVETANGLQLPYDKLLIATGSHPLTPPIPGLDNPKVGNCWDLADSRKIIENVKPGSSVVQIGAGFIGCIILESLVKRGAKLTVVEMDNRMVPRMLDDQCGGMLKSWCESKGVSVLTETMVKSIEDNGDRLTVNLSKGDAIDADYVISATGVASNTDFLNGSGIKLDEGVLVNHNLETNIPDVYAAGDVAQGIDFTTGGYSVHAIQPTAADHGTISAKNMVRGNTTRHKGSLQMNILSTLDLISTSYGAWEGVEGGEHTELVDQDNYKYIRLQFKDDQLVGANTLGITQNIGALRGLIQSKTKLGVWKERLMDNPLHFMDAYVALTGNHA